MGFIEKIKSNLSVIGIVVLLFLGAIIVYNILYLKDNGLLFGVVVDKLYVPSKYVSNSNKLSFTQYKSRDYLIATESHEQWMALVKAPSGEILKIHCDSAHYRIKQVGDTLHFKKYTGEILGIEYLSFYQEDEGDGIQ